MVTYQAFVRIGFDVAKTKGAQFDGIEQGGDFIEGLATLWNAEKDELKQMTQRQTRNYLKDKVTA